MRTKSHHIKKRICTAKTIDEASFVFIHPYMHTFDSYKSNCILAFHCSFKNIPPSSHAHDRITPTLETSLPSSLLNITSLEQHFSYFKLQPLKLLFIISCHSKSGPNFFFLQTHIKLSNILHIPSQPTK